MKEDGKTFKQYCKEAKKRLKKGFWQKYHQELQAELVRAEQAGISVSKVKEFYNERISGSIRNGQKEDDEFYLKVQRILDEEGEISNAIGRLTDKKLYSTLSYDEQQRYNLELSEKYLKAVERYRKEKSMAISSSPLTNV
jgi:hypothetical protein